METVLQTVDLGKPQAWHDNAFILLCEQKNDWQVVVATKWRRVRNLCELPRRTKWPDEHKFARQSAYRKHKVHITPHFFRIDDRWEVHRKQSFLVDEVVVRMRGRTLSFFHIEPFECKKNKSIIQRRLGRCVHRKIF